MNKEVLAARLLAAFIEDMDEQLRLLGDGLLALESNPADPENIKMVFRAAHTLKGAARATNVPYIEEGCHALEDLLVQARDGKRTLGPEEFKILFFANDALTDAAAKLKAKESLDGAPVAKLRAVVNGDAPIPASRSESSESGSRTAPTEGSSESSEPQAHLADRSDSQIRIQPEKIDALMAAGVQLLVNRSRFTKAVNEEDAADLENMINNMFDHLRRLRMRPFADACANLPRAIRDVSAASGKQAELVINGGDVEADRGVLDAVRESLIHLVRNAVDHGLEMPDVRVKEGKAPYGFVVVTAALRGERLIVTVADDGAGIDVESIRRTLIERGLPVPSNDQDLTRILFTGGFSTRSEATEISGRGVGLDAVEAAIQRIGGTVSVSSELGRGTTFTLECPLTLATIRALLVSVGGQTMAIPSSAILSLQRAQSDNVKRAEGRDVFLTDSNPIPLVSLARLLGPPLAEKKNTGSVPLVIMHGIEGQLAVAVDQLLDEEEIVVRPIERVGSSPLLSGAAILGTGEVALVINTTAVIPAGLGITAVGKAFIQQPEAQSRKRVLIVDDSITTRTLEQGTVESAGYDTVTAVDGADAWRLLQEQDFDLVVSDVEMPRMDGLTLCENVRRSKKHAKLPFILVTALESPTQRMRGLEVGADAYIGKSTFDQQNLVESIRQLIG